VVLVTSLKDSSSSIGITATVANGVIVVVSNFDHSRHILCFIIADSWVFGTLEIVRADCC